MVVLAADASDALGVGDQEDGLALLCQSCARDDEGKDADEVHVGSLDQVCEVMYCSI